MNFGFEDLRFQRRRSFGPLKRLKNTKGNEHDRTFLLRLFGGAGMKMKSKIASYVSGVFWKFLGMK
jgi:hypothetical protein